MRCRELTPGALQRPRPRDGWQGEGGSGGRGRVSVWLIHGMYGRNHHNAVKQLLSNTDKYTFKERKYIKEFT